MQSRCFIRFWPDKIQHARISFALRATQATFKSMSAFTTTNYRNGNRSKPQSLELITLPSPSTLVWLACKAPRANSVWVLPLTISRSFTGVQRTLSAFADLTQTSHLFPSNPFRSKTKTSFEETQQCVNGLEFPLARLCRHTRFHHLAMAYPY